MRVAILLFLLPTVTVSQLLATKLACIASGLPECFCSCFAPLVISYCALDRIVCPCTNSRLLQEVTTCALSSCTASEVQNSKNIVERRCSAKGLPLSTSVVAATSATTAAVATGEKSTSTAAGSGGASGGDGKKGGLGAGAIAGIVVGVVGGIAAGAVITFLLLGGRKSRATPLSPPPPPPPQPPQQQQQKHMQVPPYGNGKTEVHSEQAALHPSEPPVKMPMPELDSAHQTLASTQLPAQWHGDGGGSAPVYEMPHR